MMLAAIFDVDGTLADVSGCRHHVDLTDPRNTGRKRFDLFHEEASGAPSHPHVVGLTHALRPDITPIVVTARKRMWEVPTVWWLLLNNVRFAHLFMRADHDQRPDFDVKADILRHIQTRFTVVLAVDDNPNVIRLWTEHDIPTITVPGWRV